MLKRERGLIVREDTAKQSKDTPSENTSQINQVKESLVKTESRLPLPPAGSLNSESGESGTGVRYLLIYLTIKPRSRFNTREFKINDATAATTPQNLHT